jgi:Predicted Fe-S oxidoreductases
MSQLLSSLAVKEKNERADTFEKYLIRRAVEKGIPLIGHFELTPRCTLDCSMCYVHLNKTQMCRNELKLEEWMSLITQACDAGMLYATLTGGECLLYPGFRQIYEYLQSRGVLVTVFTNGTLLDEDTVNWLSQRPPKRIQISVYGSSSEGYKNVTGNGEAFYRVDRAIDLLLKADIPINFAITVSKQMIADFEEILRYCNSKKEGITRVSSSMFEARPDTERKFENFAPSLDEIVSVFKIRQKVFNESCRDNYTLQAEDTENEQNERLFYPEKGVICTAGRFGFSISWEGKMIPCSIFDYAGRYPLSEGFQSAWKYINSKCREYTNPIECVFCKHNNTCRRCPASHYMRVGEGHVNPDICLERNRMHEETG